MTVDNAGHPVDYGLLLLAIAVKVLNIGITHRPLFLCRKPGKSENASSTFRVSAIAM
jgi:hypothetical protein